MKAGIIVDNWKLPIFHKTLKEADYIISEEKPMTSDSTFLSIEYSDLEHLKVVVQDCQNKSAKSKLN